MELTKLAACARSAAVTTSTVHLAATSVVRLAEAAGILVVVTAGRRKDSEQRALYAK